MSEQAPEPAAGGVRIETAADLRAGLVKAFLDNADADNHVANDTMLADLRTWIRQQQAAGARTQPTGGSPSPRGWDRSPRTMERVLDGLTALP